MDDSLLNERDRQLAASLSDSGGGIQDGQDGLVDAIRDYAAEYRKTEIAPRAGTRLWASVERATRSGAGRPSLRLVSVKKLAWGGMAVAAAIAILLIVPGVLEPADGQVIAEAMAEQVEYRTSDGSTVLLRPYSRLFSTGEIDSYRLEGEAFFDVIPNSERTFSVVTVSGAISVLGTRFNVEAVGVETTVFLETGSIRFETTSGSVMLRPGEVVHASNGVVGAPTPSPSSGVEETDWTQGQLVFEGRTAREVAGELSRHYDVGLDIPTGVGQETLSGRILLAQRAQALEDFALVLGGRFVQAGDGQRFIRN